MKGSCSTKGVLSRLLLEAVREQSPGQEPLFQLRQPWQGLEQRSGGFCSPQKARGVQMPSVQVGSKSQQCFQFRASQAPAGEQSWEEGAGVERSPRSSACTQPPKVQVPPLGRGPSFAQHWLCFQQRHLG